MKKFKHRGTYLNSVVSLVVGTTPLLCLCSSTLMPHQPASKYHYNTYRLLLINQIPKCRVLRHCLNNSQCCFKANEHLCKINILVSALMKIHFFWDNTPCQLPNNYWTFGACCFHHQGLSTPRTASSGLLSSWRWTQQCSCEVQ